MRLDEVEDSSERRSRLVELILDRELVEGRVEIVLHQRIGDVFEERLAIGTIRDQKWEGGEGELVFNQGVAAGEHHVLKHRRITIR